MSIETAVFAVQRGDQQFSCKGSELRDKLTDGDILLVNRGGVDYHFVLTEQGKLKLIEDVDFEFADNGSIVITQNAEATGGDTPYRLKTEYDIELSTDLVELAVPEMESISAATVNNTAYVSFGIADPSSSEKSQGLYSFDIASNEYIQNFTNTEENEPPFKVNNRFGLKKVKFQGKDILIDVYNKTGSTAVSQTYQFVMCGLEEDQITDELSVEDIEHLNIGNGAPCCGIVSDNDGNLYSVWYQVGIFKHENVPADSLGYPDFTDKSIVTTNLFTLSNNNYKGVAFWEEAKNIVFVSGSKTYSIGVEAHSNLRSSLGLAQNAASKTAVLAFTEHFVVRTVLSLGSIDGINTHNRNLNSNNKISGAKLFINDADNKYLFMIEGNQPIKYIDYNSTLDPASTAWKVFREEKLPPGDVGAAGTITLEPFSLTWFQNGKLKTWGTIPDLTAEVTVNQTITDTNGDSVSSSTTKAPL